MINDKDSTTFEKFIKFMAGVVFVLSFIEMTVMLKDLLDYCKLENLFFPCYAISFVFMIWVVTMFEKIFRAEIEYRHKQIISRDYVSLELVKKLLREKQQVWVDKILSKKDKNIKDSEWEFLDAWGVFDDFESSDLHID